MIQFDKRLVSKKELKSVCGIPYTPQHIGRLEAGWEISQAGKPGAGSGRMVDVRGGCVGERAYCRTRYTLSRDFLLTGRGMVVVHNRPSPFPNL